MLITDKTIKKAGEKGFAVLAVLFFAVSLNMFYATAKKHLTSFFLNSEYFYASAKEDAVANKNVAAVSPFHIKTPKSVKALYMSSWVASTPSLRNELIKLIDDTELNAVVIDVKDYSGKIFLKTEKSAFEAVRSAHKPRSGPQTIYKRAS